MRRSVAKSSRASRDMVEEGNGGAGKKRTSPPPLNPVTKKTKTQGGGDTKDADVAMNMEEIEERVNDDDAGKKVKPTSGCADSAPLLNEYDESTKTPGLFLVGPAVRHQELSFCFVYKFRQRFGVVADAIARGLGYRTAAAVEECRDMNMFLDDFSCCQSACGEAC